MKLEGVRARHPQLLYESKVYRLLQGGVGIPHVRFVFPSFTFEWSNIEINTMQLWACILWAIFLSSFHMQLPCFIVFSVNFEQVLTLLDTPNSQKMCSKLTKRNIRTTSWDISFENIFNWVNFCFHCRKLCFHCCLSTFTRCRL